MRKAKIGVMDFHGSVDITDPLLRQRRLVPNEQCENQ